MRIVFIGPFAMQPKRTMAVRALPLAQALAARGHQVLVVLPPWDSPQDSGREWAQEGVQVHNVRLPLRLPLIGHLWLTLRLLKAALGYRPEVIHCFKPKSYSGLAAWVLWHLQRLGRTQVRLVVDADDWEGAGGWNELQGYPWAQRRFFSWQEHWGLTHCDAHTVASRALETIVWSLGVRPDRVHYLPNGWQALGTPSRPDGEGAAASEEAVLHLRQKHGLGDAPVGLLYTRFFEFSVERALGIMQGILAEMPEVRWLVVGRGLFGEEERLLALARERGMEQQVKYAGWVPPDELPAYFAVAQCAIYPFDDTLVNRCKCAVKLIDLLGAGVPVVADAVGQNREYIEDAVSGILVPSGDQRPFVEAVLRVLRDRPLATRLGSGAVRRIQARFGWATLARQAEAAYAGGSADRPENASVSHLR